MIGIETSESLVLPHPVLTCAISKQEPSVLLLLYKVSIGHVFPSTSHQMANRKEVVDYQPEYRWEQSPWAVLMKQKIEKI